MDSIQPMIGRGKDSTPKRVQKACLRCHKQKLKCDIERPCALCTRSSVECRENSSRFRGNRTLKPKSHDPPSNHETIDLSIQNLSPGRVVPPAHHLSQSQSSQSGIPSPVSLGSAELPYEERPSTYPLVNHMFEKYNSASGVRSIANAIPNGSPSQRTSPNTVRRVPVSDVIGMDLPSREITNLLLDSYLKNIHWFIMVIHEPSLRSELDDIMTYGTLQPTRLPFLALVLVILAFGSNYIADEDAQTLGPGFDRQRLEKNLIRKVEEKFLDIWDGADVESVQLGVVLSAYYVYFGHPKRATIVYDATLTCAKALGLHQEPSWGDIDPLTREIRRRTWWAIYAGDGFTAVYLGRPCSIIDSDWRVRMVCNIDDTSITCPGFQSMETLEDGSVERVTILSYRRCKYKLYQIVSAILKNVYFTKGKTIEETAKKVKAINERLLAWEKDVPPELRLSSFKPDAAGCGRYDVLETFQLQALALHLFYNNIQLLLHRPLLTYTGLSRQNRKSTGTTSNDCSSLSSEAIPSTTFDAHLYQSSKNQCWESAMQTSNIGDYRSLLLAARNTPVAPYIGIQAFTAGAVLGLFALSAPLTSVSMEAKRALGRLIKMPQSLGFHNLVSEQCGNILKELVHLILSEETRLLTSDLDSVVRERLPDTASASARPTQTTPQAWELRPNAAESHWSGGDYDHLTPQNVQERPALPDTANSLQSLEVIERDGGGFAYSNGQLTHQDGFPATVGEDFNHALLSLQTVFGDERIRTTGQHPFSDDGQSAMMPFTSAATASTFGTEMGFDDTSQTWIWGENFNFQ